MKKLTNMDLPKNKPMHFCERCRAWVPDKGKGIVGVKMKDHSHQGALE